MRHPGKGSIKNNNYKKNMHKKIRLSANDKNFHLFVNITKLRIFVTIWKFNYSWIVKVFFSKFWILWLIVGSNLACRLSDWNILCPNIIYVFCSKKYYIIYKYFFLSMIGQLLIINIASLCICYWDLSFYVSQYWFFFIPLYI